MEYQKTIDIFTTCIVTDSLDQKAIIIWLLLFVILANIGMFSRYTISL